MLNSCEEISQIKLISECFVTPKNEVESSNQPHYLGPIDLALLSLDQMQKGLLFPSKPKNIKSHLLDKFKNSLSISLVHFYPLAGRLATQKFHDEHAIWVYVDGSKGPGARLIHASVDDLLCYDLISSNDVHPIVRSFFDLGEKAVNHDGHTRPLLSIQVTELLDGVFIGFTMNHSIADGTSLWHFISTLSQIFLQLDDNYDGPKENAIMSISHRPIFEPFFPVGFGPILKLPFLEPNEFITPNIDIGPLREKIFDFSSTSISKIKIMANQECGLGHHTISSFQALCAFLWISVTRARNLEPDQETTFGVAINFRPKINPPLTGDYFGGFIKRAHGTCNVGELLGKGLGWAATIIHELIIGLDDKAIRAFLNRLIEAPFVVQPNMTSVYYQPNSLLIGGSTKFDMYGPEFGLGKAVAVLAGYGNKEDGKVTANPGREGGGSVDLEVCLRPETMNALVLNEEFMSFVSYI
ncbi:uncharacterized acetyltransferase At3g50280-like [Chenopodium quinoa]|uniref:uncharacterized acetyltransferase At3g50280-like n=1 Tax=Chenopodium quinoa TaxID=63459 RepID=UPI000B787167|nr:uncharacterized acetyltransferase At3g50280-like [Chenopodium quinoa]